MGGMGNNRGIGNRNVSGWLWAMAGDVAQWI